MTSPSSTLWPRRGIPAADRPDVRWRIGLPRGLGPSPFSGLTNELGLSDLDLRSALGADARTLDRWRKGECYPQHEARARLDRLAILQAGLRETFTDTSAVRAWMVEDSRYLGHLKPTDVARRAA